MLLVPTSDPGYSCTLIRTRAENEGRRLITNQLNHERVTLAAHGTMAIRALHDVRRWTRKTRLADGRRVADLPRSRSTAPRPAGTPMPCSWRSSPRPAP